MYDEIFQKKQEEYDILPMNVFQIELEMSSPFSSLQPIHSDSLIAYFSAKDLLGENFFNSFDGEAATPPLPIKTSNIYGVSFFCASSFIPSYHIETITRWRKRWDEENDRLVGFKTKERINHKFGHFKAFDMPLIIKNAQKITCCINGNKKEIERLLVDCKFIGKKRSQGYGEIKSITFQEPEYDWSCFFSDHKPSRPIPFDPKFLQLVMEKTNHCKIGLQAYKPPYWSVKNQAKCLL